MLQKGEKVPEVWKFESHILEQVILDWLDESPSLSVIKASLCSDSSAVEKRGNVVTGLRLTNGQTIRSKVLILPTLSERSLNLTTFSILLKPHTKATSSPLPRYPLQLDENHQRSIMKA